jgi:hypothetical protein
MFGEEYKLLLFIAMLIIIIEIHETEYRYVLRS